VIQKGTLREPSARQTSEQKTMEALNSTQELIELVKQRESAGKGYTLPVKALCPPPRPRRRTEQPGEPRPLYPWEERQLHWQQRQNTADPENTPQSKEAAGGVKAMSTPPKMPSKLKKRRPSSEPSQTPFLQYHQSRTVTETTKPFVRSRRSHPSMAIGGMGQGGGSVMLGVPPSVLVTSSK
ncbi:hypothetical protein CYMTET_39727, partial [Cymbomonas tetramitiformis]